MLDEEVERLAGPRHARKGEGEVIYRHGSNPGSVRLGGQRHPVRVPRVRGLEGEARLESYERLHWAAGEVDEGLFRKVLLGIQCRDYEAAVEAVPGAIGLSKSTVSREFKKATARQLKAFQERELRELDVVALFLDGKTFANDEIVVALAVTMGGDKVFAGFVQTETENARVITSFLRSLKDRGLDLSAGALVVIDGAKGLKSAVTTVFRGQVLIQRCQWHKRENVVSYLPRTEQKAWRGRLISSLMRRRSFPRAVTRARCFKSQRIRYVASLFTHPLILAPRRLTSVSRCDGRGRFVDNIFIERLWRSLKFEAIYLH